MDMESCHKQAKIKGLKELLNKVYAMIAPGGEEAIEAPAEDVAESVEDKAADVEGDLNLAGDMPEEQDEGDSFMDMKKDYMKGKKVMPKGKSSVMAVIAKAKPKKYV